MPAPLETALPYLLGVEWLAVLASIGYLAGRSAHPLGGPASREANVIVPNHRMPPRVRGMIQVSAWALLALLIPLAVFLPILAWLAFVLAGLGSSRVQVNWGPFGDLLATIESLAVLAAGLALWRYWKQRFGTMTGVPDKGL